MSKYDELARHLAHSAGAIELSFADIEELLGFRLPSSARRHAAWWSNSEGTHVQAAAWLSAGYRTEAVSLVQERIRFIPERSGGFGEMKQSTYQTGKEAPKSDETAQVRKNSGHHPAFGALKGMITLLPNVDYSEPADPDWGRVYED